MLVRNPRAQVSMKSARIATGQLLLRDPPSAELFHRSDMVPGGRSRPDYYSRYPHRGKFFDVSRLQLLAQPADRNFQRRRPLRRAFMLAQALDRRRDLVVAFRDSVPTVAELRRALEGRLGIAAEYDRRMRLLRGLAHELESFDADSLAVILRRILGPQLLHKREIFAGAKRAVLEVHADAFDSLCEPADSDAENKSPARKHVQAGDRLGCSECVSNRQHEDSRREANLRRDTGDICQRQQWVV